MDVIRRSLGGAVGSSSIGGGESSNVGTYTVFLNGQWQKSSTILSPDSSLFDCVYESNINYNVNNLGAIMWIDINGYSEFSLYIRSYAESSHDYVMVSQLDQTIDNNTSYSNTTLVKAHTRGNQQSGTALSNYTLVEFTNIDGGRHRITVVYKKDSSSHIGTDRGYVLIHKSGAVELDLSKSIYYTTRNGQIAEPSASNVFGTEIISNIYENGVGLITCNGTITKIGTGDKVFTSGGSIKTIQIPNTVTKIGNKAFYNNSFSDINIPGNVIEIGDYAFAYNNYADLNSLIIGNGVQIIGEEAFSNLSYLIGSIIIPDSVTTIKYAAFRHCHNVKNIIFGNGLKNIGSSAFASMSGLTGVSLPSSITNMPSNPFRSCHKLKSFAGPLASNDKRCIILNGVVKSFAPYGLTEYTIPNDATEVGKEAFTYCTELTKIIIPDSVTTIQSYAFSDCHSLTDIVIGKNVNTVQNDAFSYTGNIENVYISDISSFCKIKYGTGGGSFIGDKTLYINNELVTDIIIPTDVTFISDYAFYECKNLISVTFPENLTSIGKRAFYGCSNINTLYFKGSTPPTFGEYAFYGLPSDKKIYVPMDAVDAYKSKFNGTVEGYDFT